MGKIKNNLRHSNALRQPGKVQKETPDTKSRRVSEGIKGKLIKKKLRFVGKKKRKGAKGKSWASDSRVDCDWCGGSFCR